MMNKNFQIIKKNLFLLFISLHFLACRKEAAEPDRYPDIPQAGSTIEKVLDSIYMYAHELWLWQSQLPSFTDAGLRNYASIGAPEAYNRALFSLLSPIRNKETGEPYERELHPYRLKYSYFDRFSSADAKYASLSANGIAEDFGLELGQVAVADVRVAYVTPGSPAALAGIQRGHRLLSLNGQQVTDAESANQILAFGSILIELQREDGHIIRETLSRNLYQSDGIFKSKRIKLSNQEVGYLAFSRFINQSDALKKMETVFADFAHHHIQTLIIDLRYNTGGYVSAVKEIANCIAPANISGKTMYSEHYNQLMQKGEAKILANQLYLDKYGQHVYRGNRRATYFDVDYSVSGNTETFQKKGALEKIKRIYFIVSSNTASAAEMLINVLKPHMEVKLVGSTTYGKPVGFFGIKLAGNTLFLSSFLIKNSDGKADYLNGFVPDILAGDDLSYDFGDRREGCLAMVLDDIQGKRRKSSINNTPTSRLSKVNQFGEIKVSGFRGLLKNESKFKNVL